MARAGRSILASLLTAFAPALASAQANVRVTDEGGRPVPYAVVQHKGATPRIADDSGRVAIGAPERDSLEFDVRRIGFRPFYGWAKRGDGGAYAVILRANVQVIDATYVTEMANTPLARTGFYDRVARARPGAFTAEFITPEEFEMRNAMDVARILEGRRGIRVGRDRKGGPVILGRGGCGMTILLDGQFVRTGEELVEGEAPQSITGRKIAGNEVSHPNIADVIPGSEVMAVEIYLSTANAPAELVRVSGRGSCGIVAFWTGGRH